MEFDAVPAPLRERLGHEATAGLITLLADAQKEWTAEVIGIVGDRFERRLTEETSRLRIEMTQGFAGLRQEIAAGLAAVRQEMAGGLAAGRLETAAVRQEVSVGFAALRQEMADQRFELLKWAFLFWVGQFFAVAGLIAVLIRFLRPAG